jgi:cystathionine gamma-synthase
MPFEGSPFESFFRPMGMFGDDEQVMSSNRFPFSSWNPHHEIGYYHSSYQIHEGEDQVKIDVDVPAGVASKDLKVEVLNTAPACKQFEDALLLPPATQEDDYYMISDDITESSSFEEVEPPKMAISSSASTSTEDSIVSTDSDVVQATSPTSSTLDGDSPIVPVAPLKKQPQKILKKSPSSIMYTYTNPAAAHGIAAELLRAKMDAKEFLEDLENTKEARRRWLGSFYAHAGISGTQNSNDTVPLSPPLVLATNFQIRSSGAWSDEDFFYSRISNPTRSALEETLAAAEQGRRMDDDDGDYRCQAACFGSGMAAVSAVLGAAAGLMSSPQDRKVHVVVPKTCYDEAIKLLKMGSGGIASFIRVDMTNLEAVHKALAKHPDRGKVLYMETPDNPLTQVADLEKLVELARFHKAVTVVDTTWSPPVVGQVFRFQVDALCFSCTKTMGGHSDVLCGGVVANGATALGRQLFPRVRDWQICHGGVASPFDCFLVLRGLRTLPVRMERMCSTTLALATFLESHDSIEWVRYPGLESHPQHELAKRQMDLFGQILTFCIKGDSEAAMAFVGAVSLVRRATSTGGTETLVQHQRSVEQIKVTQGGVIRVSVGLENARDVIDDFSKALDCSKEVCATLGGPIRRNECIGGADEEFVAKDCDQVQVGAKQDRVIMSRVVSTV